MSIRRHWIFMLIASGGILAVLWIAGVSVGAAAPLALFLACPLMMFFMMRGMDHNPQANHVHPPEGHSQDDPMIRH